MTIVGYRYHTPVFRFSQWRKYLNHDPTKFTARKQDAVSDQQTTQDQKSLFSVEAASCKFSDIHHLSERFALTQAE